jgi:plasmid stabilization system protein ParE
MAWQVLITDSALADLREIVEFIAQDDPQAASCTSPASLRDAWR